MAADGVQMRPGGLSIDPSLLGSIIAAILQIGAAVMQWPGESRTIFYISVLAASAFAVIAFTDRRKAGNAPYFVIAGGVLLSLAIFVLPAWADRPPSPPPQPGNYYVRVLTYIDTNANGVLDGSEKPLPDVHIRARDFRGVESSYFTDAMGEAQVILADFGQVSIGVCGVFQSHAVTAEHSSPEASFEVGVGIDPSRQRGCANR